MAARSGATQEEVRRHNLGAVLEHLHRNGGTSRADLTALLGLNRSTIGALVNDLVARGLVEEVEPVQRGRTGRPSPLVRPRPDRLVVVAMDIKVDSVSVAIVGIGGTVLAQQWAAYPTAAPDPPRAVRYAVKLTRKLLSSLGRETRLAGVGVGVAGVVRCVDGLVHMAPNLGWRDVPLGDLVARSLDADVDVHVGNDANLGAIAEHARGVGRGVDDLIYVASEVGVGFGVLTGGRLLTGADGYFGEFGHVPLFPRGRECRCGARGCWETEVGTHRLLERAGRPPDAGPAAVRDVLTRALEGDRTATAAVRHVSDRLVVGLTAAVNAFNPRLIILGGFFADLWPLVGERVERALREEAMRAPVHCLEIKPALLGEDAVLLGAAETALATVLHNPTMVPASAA